MTNAKKNGPIVAIQPVLPPVNLPIPRSIPLSAIARISERANLMLEDVREKMLAPHPRKKPPVYSSSQVAELCGLDKTKINYHAARGDIPFGTVEGAGKSRFFSLVETRQCIRHFNCYPKPALGDHIVGKKIAISNAKGGVSKTTTTMTLAQGLSLRGYDKILIVDLDPQASLTSLTGILPDTEIREEDTIMPLVYGEADDLSYAVRETYWDGIDIIPSNGSVFTADFILPSRVRDPKNRETDYKFYDVLNRGLEPLLSRYQVILCDSAPAMSYVNVNSYMAADAIIVPTPPNAMDFASSTQFWSLFAELTADIASRDVDLTNKVYDFLCVLLTKVDHNQLATSVVRGWIERTYGELVLPVEIPTTTIAQSSAAEFGTVYDISKYDGNQKTYQRAREAYDAFAEIIDNMLLAVWNKELDEVNA